MTMGIITAQAFSQLIKNETSLNILDIRSELEFENMRLDYNVTHTPMHKITADEISKIRTDKQQPLYILCKMGPRAQTIAQFLLNQGHDNMIVIDGGITGCKAEGVQMIAKTPATTPEEITLAAQESVQKFMVRQGVNF